MAQRALRIAFVHPDLGIGGAERLVIDAATGLQSRGHSVVVHTSHHDPSRCFPETIDGTLKVSVYGDFLPRHIFGGMFVICAMIRSMYLCSILVYQSIFKDKVDVYIVDQVSIGVPLLKLTGSKILFYCHFPDKLLAPSRSKLHTVYRWPIDKLEECTTACADELIVNSKFTRAVVQKVFSSIKHEPHVVYPGVEARNSIKYNNSGPRGRLFLSLNRFERKKNLGIAIKAFAMANLKDACLVIAGGYDVRSSECKAVLEHLQQLSDSLNLSHITLHAQDRVSKGSIFDQIGQARIVFLTLVSEDLKHQLFEASIALIYTPSYEHFGIVPIESMLAGIPVIAIGNGGPAETILHKITGYLCGGWVNVQDAPAGPEQVLDVDHLKNTLYRHSFGYSDEEDEKIIGEFSKGLKWAFEMSTEQRRIVHDTARAHAIQCFSKDSLIEGFSRVLFASKHKFE